MANAREAFIKRQYTDFHEMVDRTPFVSEGKAVFYSSAADKQNGKRAAAYASHNGMVPINKTQGGEFLNGIHTRRTFGGARDDKLWARASRKYAHQVTGSVRTFVAGGRANGIYRQVELPALLTNKKVNTMNGLDRVRLKAQATQQYARLRSQGMGRKAAYNQALNTTHRKVAIAEVRADLKQAQQKNDAGLRVDAKQRLTDLKTQHRAEQAEKRSQHQGTTRTAPQKASRAVSKPNDRLGAIYDRAVEQAAKRGATPENARLAAQSRVDHVKAKVALNQERAVVKAAPTKTVAQAYVNRSVEFQAKRVVDLQAQAKRENTVYHGPPVRSQTHQNFQKKTDPRELSNRAQLENRHKAGEITPKAYEAQKVSQEKTLSQTRADNFKQAYGYDYSQRSHFEAAKPTTSSYDHSLHTYTYSRPSYQAPVSHAQSNLHSNNSYGHGNGYGHGHSQGH